MSVTIERLSPSDALPIGGLRERRRRLGALRDRGTTIEIGLVNNMPDAAMPSTERQFANLLSAASARFDVRSISSRSAMCRARRRRARSSRAPIVDASHIRAMGARRADRHRRRAGRGRARRGALLARPRRAHRLGRSQYVLDDPLLPRRPCRRARISTASRGEPLPDEMLRASSNSTPSPRHPLFAGLDEGVATPHSRRNGLDRRTSTEQGYQVLTYRAEIGVDVFVKQRRAPVRLPAGPSRI